MPSFRYQALGPLPSPGGSRAFLGLAILDEARAEPVVLVWVPEEIAQDIEKSERIQRETERAALLEHPHIVRVYGFARMEGGRLARVVEFADGENLRRVLDAVGPLPAPLAARLVADAAQGVHYAHLAGNDDGTPLLHGDLRPETLLVTFRGQCKVAGYGAAAFAPKENRGRNIRVAPEQVLGGRPAMNVQTDVYLLGATLFECLTGKAPFEDAEDVEQAVLTKELDFAAYPQIPDELKPVIARALAKKAADRFPSALLMREAIELAIQPLPDADEVGHWLSEHFPDADGTRAERQAVVDRGVAAFARSQWAKQSHEPTARPPFPTVAPAPTPRAPTPAPIPAPAPVEIPPPITAPAPQPQPAAAVHAQPQPHTRRSAAAVIIVLLVLGASALLWFLSRREKEERLGAAPLNAAQLHSDAGAAPAAIGSAAPTHAAVAAPDAGTAINAGALTLKGPTPDSHAGNTAAATPSGALALIVEPPVTVEIDGKQMGTAPLRVPLAPGRHRLHLVDKNRGVDVTRTVAVSDKGVTTEEIFLQKGFVSVSAPPGATITIDGQAVGTAPLKTDVSVYEGSHRIEVTVGTSKWGEAFTVKPNQRVYFDVGPQYR